MATTQSTSVASARINMLKSVALLVVILFPWPQGWTRVRSVIASARSPELNRAEREVHAAGYYEGLIGGGDGPEGARGELALRLMGKPNGWVRFNDANVSRLLPGDFLQFELLPGIRRTLFGQPFVTNSHGMHSAEVAMEKPPGTFRIAVLGASMDMGWGVTYQETYSHRLEQWLNAALRPPGPRFRPAVRGAQLRRRRLQPAAAAGDVSPQGPGVPARPGDLLGDHAGPPADGDPSLRRVPERV